MDIFLYNKLTATTNLQLSDVNDVSFFIKKIAKGGNEKDMFINCFQTVFGNKELKKDLLNYIQSFTKTKIKKTISDLVKQKKPDNYIIEKIKASFEPEDYKKVALERKKRIINKIKEFIDISDKKIMVYGYNYIEAELKEIADIDTFKPGLPKGVYDIVIYDYIYHKISKDTNIGMIDYVNPKGYYYYYYHPYSISLLYSSFQYIKNYFEIKILGYDEPTNKFTLGEYEMYFPSPAFIKQRMSGNIHMHYGNQHNCSILYEKKNDKDHVIELFFKCKPSGSKI